MILSPLISLRTTAISANTNKRWIKLVALYTKKPKSQAMTKITATTYNRFPISIKYLNLRIKNYDIRITLYSYNMFWISKKDNRTRSHCYKKMIIFQNTPSISSLVLFITIDSKNIMQKQIFLLNLKLGAIFVDSKTYL